MSVFIESDCCFTFDDANWWAIQYDTHKCHTSIKLENHKAIDILAIKDDKNLFFFEMKGFRSQSYIANSKRITEELPSEIAQKVRDSIAAMVGYNLKLDEYADDIKQWKTMLKLLSKTHKNIHIIAWVEPERQSISVNKRKTDLGILRDRLKQKLAWLTSSVQVMNIENSNLEGLLVTNMPLKPIV
jgi:hypothetical protein